MTSQPAFQQPEPFPEEAPDTDPDFADEHDSVSVTDTQEGGPERVPEPETPQGHAGME